MKSKTREQIQREKSKKIWVKNSNKSLESTRKLFEEKKKDGVRNQLDN